jgi:SAM-dependent methyltransferase
MKKVIKSIFKKIDRIIFPDIYNSRDSLVEILKENILFDCESILDVGCGVTQNSPLLHIAPKMKKVVGIDLFEPSIEKKRTWSIVNIIWQMLWLLAICLKKILLIV